MSKSFFTIVFLQLSVVFGLFLPPPIAVSSFAPDLPQAGGSGFKVREVNVYAPQLYGDKKQTRLGALKERTIILTGVGFKQKVPDAQRTKFAHLMTGYSVKIFDAELNTTV